MCWLSTSSGHPPCLRPIQRDASLFQTTRRQPEFPAPVLGPSSRLPNPLHTSHRPRCPAGSAISASNPKHCVSAISSPRVTNSQTSLHQQSPDREGAICYFVTFSKLNRGVEDSHHLRHSRFHGFVTFLLPFQNRKTSKTPVKIDLLLCYFVTFRNPRRGGRKNGSVGGVNRLLKLRALAAAAARPSTCVSFPGA